MQVISPCLLCKRSIYLEIMPEATLKQRVCSVCLMSLRSEQHVIPQCVGAENTPPFN